MDWVKAAYRPAAWHAAHRALVGRVRDRNAPDRGRFTGADASRALAAAWRRYDEASAKLAPQPTLGSTMNVRLACFTFSFFEELLAIGTERKYAIELVADATWSVYELWARGASAIGRLTPWKGTSLAFAVRDRRDTVKLRFPFNAPGYGIRPIASQEGTAFDVVGCPVATYFRELGAADLCLASWCNLDFPLSEMTHQRLVRTKTLVEGPDRCDFRIFARAIAMSVAGDHRQCAVDLLQGERIMALRRGPWRPMRAALALFAVLCLLVSVVLGGHRYFYCTLMNEASFDSCCERGPEPARQDGPALDREPCCVGEHFSAPAPASVAGPEAALRAPVVAVLSVPLPMAERSAPTKFLPPRLSRDGPCDPNPRDYRDRLMVFLS